VSRLERAMRKKRRCEVRTEWELFRDLSFGSRQREALARQVGCRDRLVSSRLRDLGCRSARADRKVQAAVVELVVRRRCRRLWLPSLQHEALQPQRRAGVHHCRLINCAAASGVAGAQTEAQSEERRRVCESHRIAARLRVRGGELVREGQRGWRVGDEHR